MASSQACQWVISHAIAICLRPSPSRWDWNSYQRTILLLFYFWQYFRTTKLGRLLASCVRSCSMTCTGSRIKGPPTSANMKVKLAHYPLLHCRCLRTLWLPSTIPPWFRHNWLSRRIRIRTKLPCQWFLRLWWQLSSWTSHRSSNPLLKALLPWYLQGLEIRKVVVNKISIDLSSAKSDGQVPTVAIDAHLIVTTRTNATSSLRTMSCLHCGHVGHLSCACRDSQPAHLSGQPTNGNGMVINSIYPNDDYGCLQ